MPAELDVRIEKIVVGGDGLARHEGRVVFVPGTAPGERHRVRLVREKKDFARARSVEILEAAPTRRHPPCPYYESCGGCALMHLRPEAQVEVKKAILTEGLERAGTLPRTPLSTLSAAELGYRNRLRFHVAFSEERSRPVLGFRRRGSHEVVDVEACLLGSPELNETWRLARRAIADRKPLARNLVSVELDESSHERGRIAARFLVSSTHGLRGLDEGRREELQSALGLRGLVAAVSEGGPVARTGQTWVEHRVGDLALRQSVGSFFQANRFLLEGLVDAVVPPNVSETGSRGLDLYCGVGLFALPLAQRVSSVVGVEGETLAIRDAKENAVRAGVGNVRFVRGDASAFAARGTLRDQDVVLLDPPRGVPPPELLEALGRSPLRSIRYVSCDPAALFRDSARLAAHGFAIDRATLVDLFPNTHHFETVVVFSRDRPSR
jgi:23S rRNA (uracil1939-C5)-methyltransferase